MSNLAADDILRALGTSDDDSDDDDSVEPTQDQTNSKIKEVRDWGKGWEKKSKELAKEVAALHEFKTGVETREREGTAKTVFKELGLSEKMADLYLKVNDGEVSAGTIRQFAVDYDLVVDEGTGTTESKSQGFEPGGPGVATAPGPSMISQDDWMKLSLTDPVEAQKKFRDGRVDMSGLRTGLGPEK